MNWEQLDWPTLDRLRDTFLTGKGSVDYWRSPDDLANYDLTFGARIGWKWDAVLRELHRLNWMPMASTILDWGCGSGIAGRRVKDAFRIPTLRVFDRSRLAVQFACEAGNAAPWRNEPVGLLVLSHVINEAEPGELLRIARQAAAILWVEPGTYEDSRALIAMREKLREEFRVVAPCPHQGACGMSACGNTRHWCHFFAAPPKGVMADSNWVKCARRAGIDLRSLPYSYLVLERKGCTASAPLAEISPATTEAVAPQPFRLIGEPRLYKGFAKVLNCRASGVREDIVQKRDAPELFKAWRKGGRNSCGS